MTRVTVAETSIRRAWRRDGDGSLWLRFRATGGDGDATTAFSEAVVAANDAVGERFGDGPVGISTDVPVDTPKGPVLFVAFCDTTELLDEWLAAVVKRLERAGWRGKLTAAQPDASPLDSPGGELLGVTAGLVLRIDHEAATAYKRETGFSMGWFVDEATTREVVDRAPDFCLDGPGDVYLRFGFVQFRVDPADVPRLIRDATARRLAPTLALTRIGPDGSVHRMSVGNLGHVIYELVDPAEKRVVLAQRLSEVLVDHAPMLEYGLVRLGLTPMVGWHQLVDHLPPRLPHRRGSYSRVVRHLEPSRVPDAYGIQLLSDQHLAGGPDLTAWEVRQVAGSTHLVTAPDLEAWFDRDQPDEATLERARQDFAPVILTRDDV